MSGVQSPVLGEYLALVRLEVREVPALPGSRSDDLVAQNAAFELLEEITGYAGGATSPLRALPLQFCEFPAAIANCRFLRGGILV